MNQIAQFVPVYIACGGTKEEALDFMFARKVLTKIQEGTKTILKRDY